MKRIVGIRRERRKLANGKEVTYLYNRKTGERIHAEEGTPEFALEVAKQNEGRGKEGYTLKDAFAMYMLTPDFKRLKSVTKDKYEYAIRKLEPWMSLPVKEMRRKHVIRIRNILSDTPGSANNVISKLSTVLQHALDIEIIDINPCHRIKKLPIGEHQAWTQAEIDRFFDNARPDLRLAAMMGLYTCQRIGDLVTLRWSAYDGSVIRLTQSKTGTPVVIPVHWRLKQEMDAVDRMSTHILTTTQGRPWAYHGLRTALKREFVRLGLPQARFHGFRKSGMIYLAEMGCTAPEIMAISGHKTMAQAQQYITMVEQEKLARSAMKRTEAGIVIPISGDRHGLVG